MITIIIVICLALAVTPVAILVASMWQKHHRRKAGIWLEEDFIP